MSSDKGKRKRAPPTSGNGDGEAEAAGPADDQLFFKGITAYFVDTGVQPRRLQIWKQKVQQMGVYWRSIIRNISATCLQPRWTR